jgi:hypothetical protein
MSSGKPASTAYSEEFASEQSSIRSNAGDQALGQSRRKALQEPPTSRTRAILLERCGDKLVSVCHEIKEDAANACGRNTRLEVTATGHEEVRSQQVQCGQIIPQ